MTDPQKFGGLWLPVVDAALFHVEKVRRANVYSITSSWIGEQFSVEYFGGYVVELHADGAGRAFMHLIDDGPSEWVDLRMGFQAGTIAGQAFVRCQGEGCNWCYARKDELWQGRRLASLQMEVGSNREQFQVPFVFFFIGRCGGPSKCHWGMDSIHS